MNIETKKREADKKITTIMSFIAIFLTDLNLTMCLSYIQVIDIPISHDATAVAIQPIIFGV